MKERPPRRSRFIGAAQDQGAGPTDGLIGNASFGYCGCLPEYSNRLSPQLVWCRGVTCDTSGE